MIKQILFQKKIRFIKVPYIFINGIKNTIVQEVFKNKIFEQRKKIKLLTASRKTRTF